MQTMVGLLKLAWTQPRAGLAALHLHNQQGRNLLVIIQLKRNP
jgi:hypothetical protein